MNDIKNVIGILCQHLNYLFEVKIVPEHFRLAKFDKCDQNVVEHFWNLLHKFTKSDNSDVINAVKTFFYSLNYRNLAFYSLPKDMSYGSRELLIAIGFIIANNYLFKSIQFKIDNTPFNPKNTILLTSQQRNLTFDERSLPIDKDKVDAIRWVKGRIYFLKKATTEANNTVTKLMETVGNTYKISNVNNLSINEIFALKKKEIGECFLLETDIALVVLENHEKWMKKEKVFWEWMNTVLIEKQKHPERVDYDAIEDFHLVLVNNRSS